MAYPDGTTVIRYYPVEQFTEERYTNSDLPVGLSIWVKRVDAGTPIGELNTTFYPENPFPQEARYRVGPYVSGPFGPRPEWADYMAVTTVPLPSPGDYAEAAFVPLTPEGWLAPVTAGDLPLDLRIGFGDSDYAGGVIQVGIYLSGEFVLLASLQHSGAYFQDGYVAPGGWESLPAPIEGSFFSVSYEDGSTAENFVHLIADIPVPLFWTQLKQAVEV